MCQISIYIREVIIEFNVVVARESYSVFRESKVFPLLVLLLLYISQKKFFIWEFLIED